MTTIEKLEEIRRNFTAGEAALDAMTTGTYVLSVSCALCSEIAINDGDNNFICMWCDHVETEAELHTRLTNEESPGIGDS